MNLKKSIQRHGITQPLWEDIEGELIDGHKRHRIVLEMGLDYPSYVVHRLTWQERRALTLSLNDHRLTAAERSILRSLNVPARFTKVYAPNRRKAELIREDLAFLGKDAPRREIEWRQLASMVNQKRQRVKENTYVDIDPDEDVCAHHCDFRNLGDVSGLKPGSVDLIFVDPPYGRSWLPHWDALGRFAATFLKDGALLMAYAPVCYLPICQAALVAHLEYFWMGCLPHGAGKPGFKAKTVARTKMIPGWRPLLIYAKGKAAVPFPTQDTPTVGSREKEYHGWQQSIEEAAYFIRMLTRPDDLVVDPCLGTGTTGLAALRLNRRFLGCDILARRLNLFHQRLAELRQEAGSGL